MHAGPACARILHTHSEDWIFVRAVRWAEMEERRQNDRRRQKKRVFMDRRTGFDRRTAGTGEGVAATWERTLLCMRDNPTVLITVLVLANLLSILDLVFTLWALRVGAVEANPVMRGLLDTNPALAAGVKVALVGGLSVLIYAFRRYRLMLTAAVVVLLAFLLLILYHSAGMIAIS